MTAQRARCGATRRRAFVLAAALGAFLGVAWSAGAASAAEPELLPTAPASALASEPAAPTLGRAASRQASDWEHVRQVVSWLRYRTPPRRVVYLLGGSAAREAIVSESSWTTQLRTRLGRPAAGYVLSSSCQTFVEDALIVKALPKGRGVALITVGVTRFNMVHVSASVPRTSIRRQPPGRWYQHHYDWRTSLSYAEKRRRAMEWAADRDRVFVARYPARLEELHRVIDACVARGIRPVLIEMPLDLTSVRHDLDAARATYQEGCRALAAEHGAKYLDFGAKLGLRRVDFYDLWHLLRSGRAKWQARLSRELVGRRLL